MIRRKLLVDVGGNAVVGIIVGWLYQPTQSPTKQVAELAQYAILSNLRNIKLSHTKMLSIFSSAIITSAIIMCGEVRDAFMMVSNLVPRGDSY